MVRSEGYEIKRGAHFRGVPITRGSDLVMNSREDKGGKRMRDERESRAWLGG
jgi:hypothetical protein